MTEPRDGATDDTPDETSPAPVRAPDPPAPASSPRSPGATHATVLWLAAVLLLVAAGVAAAPLWAPAVMPLLPWAGTTPAGTAALAGRVAAIEQQLAQPSGDASAAKALGGLTGRIDRLEARRDADQQAAAAALQPLTQRIGALETQVAARPVIDPVEFGKIQQELGRLDNVTADLGTRVAALDKAMRAQDGADRLDSALVLAFLQIREAVAQARPFAAEYAVLIGLAGSRPAIVAAAEPLADAARDGVAGRAALAQRLGELAGQIATAKAAPAPSDWRAQALAQLRGLVTIRRIGGAAASGPKAAVGAAQLALSRDDLAGAVAALATLAGANAEAARPWLQMARERLRVDAALRRLQELLVAGLGNAAATPAPAAAPAAPAAAPASSRPPS